jgi:hypothetical protein
MKVTIEIELTPEEARTFFGMPDVKPLQDELVAKLRQSVAAAEGAFDPETLARTWLQTGLSGMERVQKAFLDALTAAAVKGGTPKR